jgi:ABC-type transporter Mla subunit MlaD
MSGSMNDWESGDLRTGLLVVGAFVLVVAGVIWTASASRQDLAPLYAEFPTLAGVTTETPVLLNGFRVGQVDGIDPQTDSLGRLTFRVRMAVQWHPGGASVAPYRMGMRVRLIPPPIDMLGTATLQLEPPTVAGGPLAPGATLPLLRNVSPLEGAQVRLDTLGTELTKTLTDTRSALAILMRSAATAADAAHSTARVAATAGAQFNDLAAATRSRLVAVDSTMRDIRAITPMTKSTTDSLHLLIADSKRTMSQLSRIMESNEPHLNRTLASLDTTTLLLQHFMREVSAKPTRLLTGVTPLKTPPPAPQPTKTARQP